MSQPNDMDFEEFEHRIPAIYKAIAAILIGMIGTWFLSFFLGVPLGGFMDAMNDTIFYHLLPFLLSITFFGILIYRTYVKQVNGLAFLGTAVLLHGIAEFIAMISEPTGSIFNRGDNFLASVGDLMFPMAVILLYLHIELIDKERPNLVHAVAILGTALPMIIGQLIVIIFGRIEIFDTLIQEIQKIVLVYLGVFAVIVVWISIFGLKVIYGTLKHADSPEVARASMFVLVGFASLLTNLALLGATYSRSLSDQPILSSEYKIHNTWLLTAALLCLILAYILHPNFAYSINFDVYQLLVLHADQGITLFSFINEVREQGDMKHAALQSPAILAVGNLVKEVASAEGHVVLIKFDKNRELIFSQVNEIVSVLITQKNSYFLNQGLKSFTKKFYHEFKEDIVNFRGKVSVFEPAKKLLHSELPFMRQEK